MLGISSAHGMEVHSSDELQFLVQQGKEGGTVEANDFTIINNAFNFSKRMARQTLIPKSQIVAIDVNDFSGTALDKIIEEGYSRLPCYENTIDEIIGVVYLKEMLVQLKKNKVIEIRSLLHPVIIIPETKRIGQLLKDFQLGHQQMAIVVDEYGVTSGLITLEDILEELVGQIQDESDDEKPAVERSFDEIYKVIATASLNDINPLLPHPIERTGGYETLAGKLINEFGHIPEVNEKIVIDNYEITIVEKSNTSVSIVQLKKIS